MNLPLWIFGMFGVVRKPGNGFFHKKRVMRHIKPLLLIFSFVLVSSTFAVENVEIKGQVFIVTKDGRSIKLGLVNVSLLQREAVDKFLDDKQKAAAPIIEKLKPICKRANDRYDVAKQSKLNATKIYEKSWGMDENSPYKKGIEQAYEQIKGIEEETRKYRDEFCGILNYLNSDTYYLVLNQNPLQPLQSVKTDADGNFQFSVKPGNYVLMAESEREIGDTSEHHSWLIKADALQSIAVHLSNDNVTTAYSVDSLLTTSGPIELSYLRPSTFDFAKLESIVEVEKTKLDALEKQKADKANEAEQAAHNAELQNFRRNPSLAQKKAIELYPDLGRAGTSLNVEFIARLKRYKAENTHFFTEPDWPIRLAKEIIEEGNK